MQVHLIDGTYEMYRQHYGSAIRDKEPPPFAATIGILSSTLQLLAEGATHIAVATPVRSQASTLPTVSRIPYISP